MMMMMAVLEYVIEMMVVTVLVMMTAVPLIIVSIYEVHS
jgi:hypothetical protein